MVPAPSKFSAELDLGGSDPVLTYSWDGQPPVPNTRPTVGIQAIEFGELGLIPETTLYLPFNEGEGDSQDVSRDNCALEVRGTEWVEGRFGSALRFPSKQARVVACAPQGATLLPAAWTIEFWIKPEEGLDQTNALILSVPKRMSVRFGEDLRCKVIVLQDQPVFSVSTERLVAGQWNHVGVSLDATDLRHIRLAVNGVQRGKRYTGAAPTQGGDRLELGGFVGELDDISLTGRASTSSELMERWTFGAEYGDHELTLERASGSETVTVWNGIAEPFLQTAADFAVGDHEHVVFDADELTRVPGDWRRYRAFSPPLARTTHPTIYIGDHRIWMFGGETKDSHLGGMINTDDTWYFRTDTEQWELVETDDEPSPSCHQSAAYSPDHKLVLYAGGWRNDRQGPTQYDETWVFHTEEGRWEQRFPGGDTFPASSDSAVVYHPKAKKFVMFMAGAGRLFVYDPAENTWTQRKRPKSFTAEGKRCNYDPGGSPMAGYDPVSDKIFLFGGVTENDERQKVYHGRSAFYDYDKNQFTEITPPVSPGARVRSGFAYDPTRQHFVLFGGVQDQFSTRMRDLWTFDPAKQTWTEHASSNTPSRRGGYYHMAYEPELDRFYLLCGRNAPHRFLNEAVSLHFDEQAVGRSRFVFDRTTFDGRAYFLAEWKAPEDSNVSLSYRGSADLVHWGPKSASIIEVLTSDVRYVQVDVALVPGASGASPAVLALGFTDLAEVNAGAGVQRTVVPVDGAR